MQWVHPFLLSSVSKQKYKQAHMIGLKAVNQLNKSLNKIAFLPYSFPSSLLLLFLWQGPPYFLLLLCGSFYKNGRIGSYV